MVKFNEFLKIYESMVQEEISVAGKGVFRSFLKSLTALGKKDNKVNFKECPEDFLIYYQLDDILKEDVKVIFNRFKSLRTYLGLLNENKSVLSFYFGVKCNGYFEYGIEDNEKTTIGYFKLNKTTIKWILKLKSKSSKSLKEDISKLSYKDIIILGKVKKDMLDFEPGYFKNKSPAIITDNIITFGYYGVGTWTKGKMNKEDILEVKSLFKKWVASKKWHSKVLFSITTDSFWLKINIKIK